MTEALWCEPYELERRREPVRLLADGKGVYGIVCDESRPPGYGPPETLILRPDLLADPASDGKHPMLLARPYAVLQPIFGGFKGGLFWRSLEERMRQELHHELMRRRGLPWPPSDDGQLRWWSTDPKQQGTNRRTWHGMRLLSLQIINRLIRQLLAEAADQDALRMARRFPFQDRYKIYRAAALSPRTLQLAEAFPALAVAIYGSHKVHDEAARLVEAGAPLRQIAELMKVPMALRRVKPRAAHSALNAAEICTRDPRLFDAHMPDTLPRVTLWLAAVCKADDLGPDFVEWTAKHCFEMSARWHAISSNLEDFGDWVKATYRAQVPPHIRRALLGKRGEQQHGEQFIVRPFTPDMSLRTVTKLSAEWHEAVANNMSGPNYAFPPPWCDGGKVNGYEIIPITTAGDLYLEGRVMHHCAGTLTEEVRAGFCCCFSIREDGNRVATLQLARGQNDKAVINQIRGPCNAQVSKPIERAVRSWLAAGKPSAPTLPKPPQFRRRHHDELVEFYDEDIPF
jgi:PcfJ-like protein